MLVLRDGRVLWLTKGGYSYIAGQGMVFGTSSSEGDSEIAKYGKDLTGFFQRLFASVSKAFILCFILFGGGVKGLLGAVL